MIYMKKIFTAVLLLILQGVPTSFGYEIPNLQKLVKLNLKWNPNLKSEPESEA